MIATEEGKFIRFHEREVRTMGRSARGVRAIELSPGTAVVGADLIDTGQEVLMVSARGYGKRVAEKEFRLQRRGGKGLIGMKISQVSGPLRGFVTLKGEEEEEFIIVTAKGIVNRQKSDQVSLMGRYARGVTLIRLDKEDRVVNLVGLD